MTKAIEAAARAIFAQRYKSSEYVFGDYLPGTDFCRSEAQAALAALKANGYAVVPVEPTEAMVDAGWLEYSCAHPAQSEAPIGPVLETYRAMIAAATPHDDGGE